MIGRIRGILLEKQAPVLLVDVAGVGYELQVSLNTFFDLPAQGETVTLHTHFVVREDAQLLFGFATLRERALFRTLIRISGVGPKMALAILSGISSDEFVRCVRADDTAMLVRLPGVGKKTAERLLVEMRDRLDGWEDVTPAAAAGGGVAVAGGRQPLQEAESALVSLGYKPQEAARLIRAAAEEGGETAASEELIRLALKSVVKK